LIRLTHDLRLLRAPSATYRALAAGPAVATRRAWLRAGARAAVAAALVGIATSVAATERITWSLAVSGAIIWSFAAVVLAITGAAIILPEGRRVSLPHAIELFLVGHGAWSLWLLGAAASVFALSPGAGQDLIALTAFVPAVWTAVVIFWFCREVLGLDAGQAAMRTAIHQALLSLAIVIYVGWAVQLWPRLLSLRIP
jgi:hypothetical protein